MSFKVVLSVLIVICAGVPAFAKKETKSVTSNKVERKVACDPESSNDYTLSHMIIGQIVRGKLLVEKDEAAYRNLKQILEGHAKYRVEGIQCSGVLNGGSACVLRVMIKIDEGEEIYNDLDVRTSREGKVTRAELLPIP